MDDIVKREKEFLNIGIQEAFLCSELLLKYVENGPDRNHCLSNMEGLVKNYCLLDHTLTIRPGVISNIAHEETARRKEGENPEASTQVPDFEKKISEKVTSAMKRIKIADHTKMKDYVKKVTRLQHIADNTGGDDDLMVTDESENFIDPLSKQELVDPVISIKCRHKFSRRSIAQHLQGKGYSTCPYVGCKEKLCADDFEDDVITAYTLRRMHLQRQL